MKSRGSSMPADDSLGAFCRHGHSALGPLNDGELDGLTFAAKDLFHVKGHRTGFGNPDWLRTHEAASETAIAIVRLLEAGASMVGKTIMDELAYSITGENVHYGTPVNSRCPDRVPGGSSSGSAAAVAGGTVDFAIGSDCGGSIRIPASYCGLFGFRPTHGRVPLEGAIPFAESFDVVGWFARDPSILETVGRVLLNDREEPQALTKLLIATDGFALLDPSVRHALDQPVQMLCEAIGQHDEIAVSPEGLPIWMECFRILQAAEIWSNHGEWVMRVKPELGPGIRERFEWASRVDAAEVFTARHLRQSIQQRLEAVMSEGEVLCLPTSANVAPLRGTPPSNVEHAVRNQAMCLLCVAGLGGLPQISLPLAIRDGCPIGVSLIGPRGSDLTLLRAAIGLQFPG